jgi:Tfp pilus assembly protein PilF
MKLHAIIFTMSILVCCTPGKKNDEQLKSEVASIELTRGEITLCSSGTDQFGTVSFSQSCSEKTRPDFNLAIALLHSFEYTEAEKVLAKVIDQDPQCVMAYWGAAMSNFHPLWSPPSPAELEKGARIITLARTILPDKSTRESHYIEAIATIYDEWNTLDHRARLLKFEKASQALYEKYTDDDEAAIFYALALGAAADPADKTFQKQKKAGDVLNRIFANKPTHPGIAHYIIHNYDYPELATLALPAARKYAAIAPASAHAQHMPSHIFTRLGLWDESIQSNIASVSAAQCYAQKSGIKGHWDEELHGLDYLMYAYLQKADDEKALEQVRYLQTIKEVFPVNFKDAYSFASMPARYAVERRDWAAAASLQPEPADFPWEKFPWEKANIYFARALGAVHINKVQDAKKDLEQLKALHATLVQAKENYKSNLVLIQVKASEAWIKLAEGKKTEALTLMTEAADMEDATAKHPVTPGEIIPARELLADMYLEAGDSQRALQVYEEDLKRHPNRFNGIYGAAIASKKSGDAAKAEQFSEQLVALAGTGNKRGK